MKRYRSLNNAYFGYVVAFAEKADKIAIFLHSYFVRYTNVSSKMKLNYIFGHVYYVLLKSKALIRSFIALWCSAHSTFFTLYLRQKKILLPALHSYLYFIVLTLKLTELPAFIFIANNFSPKVPYFTRIPLQSTIFLYC